MWGILPVHFATFLVFLFVIFFCTQYRTQEIQCNAGMLTTKSGKWTMKSDSTEELMAIGKWFYDGKIESIVHIVQTDIAIGSGDYEDPIEIRDNREGIFYYLKFFTPGDTERIGSKSGAFDSIELAKHYAGEMCTGLVWNWDRVQSD
jgi:hypothetical protein